MTDEDPITPASASATCVASFSRSSTVADKIWDEKNSPPFQRIQELCHTLLYTHEPEKPKLLRCHDSSQSQTLPDAPRIRLECPSEVIAYCLEDLDTPALNKFGDKLWWAGPTPRVASLTQQAVLDRRIQVTEDPSVHLLWTEGILYVKPLPAYLASHAFWAYLLDPSNSDINSEQREQLKTTCLGFLKTYSRLIKRRSDFNLARRHDLLASFGNATFESFVAFISNFDALPDSAISSRWRYGVINLNALNFHSALHLRRWHLNRFESRYGTYFQRFFPAVLFVFALLSVVLSAMQVILGARQLWDTDNKNLKRTLGVFIWTGTEAIGWSLGFGVCFLFWWLSISTAEAVKRWKMQTKFRKRMKAEKEKACA